MPSAQRGDAPLQPAVPFTKEILYKAPNVDSTCVFTTSNEAHCLESSQTFLAYSSASLLEIFRLHDGEYERVQSLQVSGLTEGSLGTVKGHFSSSGEGWIAVVHGCCVSIFCHDYKNTSEWVFWKTLNFDFEVLCISWSPMSDLLIAGTKLCLYRMQSADDGAQLLWDSGILASSVLKVDTSPDGLLLATLGKDDANPKIWTKTPARTLEYQFIYLSHPHPVTSFAWRKSAEAGENVIMTNCQDRVSRIWSQYSPSPGDPLKFVCAANVTLRPFVKFASDEAFVCHWLHSCEIMASFVHRNMILGSTKDDREMYQKKTLNLQKFLREYQDLIFNVGKDGSLRIWGLQSLPGKLLQIPKVNLIVKTDGVFSELDAAFFSGQSSIFYCPDLLDNSGSYFPAEIQLISQNPISGHLRAYKLSVDDLCETSFRTLRAESVASWEGPRSLVASLLPCADGRYHALTSDGRVSIWDSSTGHVYDITDFPADASPHILKWSPSGTRLIVVNGSSILLFGVNPGATKYLCTLNGSTANATWQFVGFYTEKDQLYITGISRTASPTVCVWAIQEGSETSSILISESSLFVRPDSHFVDGSLSAYLRPGLDTLLKTPWPLLFTLFSDGCLEAWQPNGNGSIVPSTDGFQVQWTKAWTQSLSANTSRFKAGPKGYVAHILAIEGQEALHISQSNDAIFMDSSMAINTSRAFISLEWHLTSCGTPIILASDNQKAFVAFPIMSRSGLEWRKQTIFLAEADEQTMSASWFTKGDIFVSTNLRCVVIDRRGAYMEVLKSTRLPCYHPSMLIHDLLWNQFDTAQYKLSLLNRCLHLAEGTGKDLVIPNPVWRPMGIIDANEMRFSSYDTLDESVPIGRFNDQDASILVERLHGITPSPHLDEQTTNALVAIVHVLTKINAYRHSLDPNGIRAVAFILLRSYLCEKTQSLSKVEFPARDHAWALHSESKDSILNALSDCYKGRLCWSNARLHGLGFWVMSADQARRQTEIMARNQYMIGEKKDPIECSLFYLALRKRNVLLGLWKLANGHPDQQVMVKLLSNDFEQERWKTAAMKNAFALLGKQRYEYAAAFFLLGDRLSDAVSVCIRNLRDIQLAILLCRVYEGDDSPLLKTILKDDLLSAAVEERDPWLANIGFTLLKDYDKALSCLATGCSLEFKTSGLRFCTDLRDPSVVILYDYLISHYTKMRFKLVLDTPLYGLYTASAEMYLKRGYYLKALELLKVVGDLNLDTIQVGDTVDSHRKVAAESSEKIIPDELKPAEQPSEVFDWSTPEPKKPAEDDFWGSYKSTAAEATLDPEPQQAADDDFWGSYKSTVAETTLDDEVLAEYDLKEPTIETEDPSISPIRESENQQGVIKCSIQDATRLATDNKVRERLRALLLWRIFTDLLDFLSDVPMYAVQWKSDKAFLGLPSLIKAAFEKACGDFEVPMGFMESALGCHAVSNPVMSGYQLLLPTYALPTSQMMISAIGQSFEVVRGAKGMDAPESLNDSFAWLKTCCRDFYGLHTSSTQDLEDLSALAPHAYLTILGLRTRRFSVLQECLHLLSDIDPSDPVCIRNKKDVLLDKLEETARMTDESKEGDGELEEELDECGLPIRFYGTKDSILAELLLQKTVIEKIAIWYERYLEMLKDSDTATTSSLGIASRVTTILSRHLHLILIAMEDPSFESVHLSTGSMIRYFDSSAKRSLWKYVAASSGEDLKVEHSQSQASESERKLSVTEGVSSVLPSQVEKSHRIKELVLFKDRGVSITSFVLNQVDPNVSAVATANGIYEFNLASLPSVGTTTLGGPHLLAPKNILSSFQSGLSKLSRSSHSLSRKSLTTRAKLSSATLNSTSSGYKLKRAAVVASMAAHPTSPYYIAGGADGLVNAYQFEQEEIVSTFTSNSSRVSKVRFDPFGVRFGASDGRTGDLHLWRFEATDVLTPQRTLKGLHSGLLSDFTFLGSPNVVASVGPTQNGSVAFWDLLLPDRSACTFQLNDPEAASSSLVHYSHRHRLLFTGGKKGHISVYDIRQGGELLDSVVAFDHQVAVRGLGMSGDCLVATSRSGTVKVFNVLEFGVSSVSRVAGRVLGVHESTTGESSRSSGPELLCHGAEIYTAVDGAVVAWHLDI